MIREYWYICRNCWHDWKSEKKETQCPKCKSKDLDIDSELRED